jgi:hypothetical protein
MDTLKLCLRTDTHTFNLSHWGIIKDSVLNENAMA